MVVQWDDVEARHVRGFAEVRRVLPACVFADVCCKSGVMGAEVRGMPRLVGLIDRNRAYSPYIAGHELVCRKVWPVEDLHGLDSQEVAPQAGFSVIEEVA